MGARSRSPKWRLNASRSSRVSDCSRNRSTWYSFHAARTARTSSGPSALRSAPRISAPSERPVGTMSNADFTERADLPCASDDMESMSTIPLELSDEAILPIQVRLHRLRVVVRTLVRSFVHVDRTCLLYTSDAADE